VKNVVPAAAFQHVVPRVADQDVVKIRPPRVLDHRVKRNRDVAFVAVRVVVVIEGDMLTCTSNADRAKSALPQVDLSP
jgi:hypothetical protein